MALPSSKQELADWVLRRLGAPIVNIEISDEQLEDVIDEGLQFYREWHMDGVERVYRTIAINNDLINKNNVRSQQLNAPEFDSTVEYSIGNRVLSRAAGSKLSGDLYLAFDTIPTDYTYDSDSEGLYFLQDPDSDGIFVLYDSDTTADSEMRYTRDSDTFLTGLLPENDPMHWRKENNYLNDPSANLDITSAGQVGIMVPNDIIGVSRVFKFNSFSQSGFFAYDYQYFLNNFDWFYGNGAGSAGLSGYYQQKTYVELIEFVLNTQPSIRYSKHRQRLYLDVDWSPSGGQLVGSGTNYFMAECYQINDPEIYGSVYSDSWLKRYVVALAKMQWGSNLKKYEGMALPGGVQVNGQVIFDEALTERDVLEEDLKNNQQLEMDGVIYG